MIPDRVRRAPIAPRREEDRALPPAVEDLDRLVAVQGAQREAEERVREMAREAERRERVALERQIAAARLRLLRELGRFLASFDESASDLNQIMHQLMTRDVAAADRLRSSLQRLGGQHPVWPEDLCREVIEFIQNLPESKRKARRLGVELDAALADPRWMAAGGGF